LFFQLFSGVLIQERFGFIKIKGYKTYGVASGNNVIKALINRKLRDIQKNQIAYFALGRYD
jgi:hypothetical protein